MADDAKTTGETAPVRLRERSAVQERILELARRARHEFLVFSPHLDPRLFNTGDLAQALTDFATRDRHNRVHFLVEDTDQAVRDNDRIVRLCRRLSDFVQLRRVGSDYVPLRRVRELFVVIDRAGYLHQPDVANPECVSAFAQPRAALPLAQRFYEMWERSEPVSAIRTVGL